MLHAFTSIVGLMERPNQAPMSAIDQEVFLRNASRYQCIRHGCYWPTFLVSAIINYRRVFAQF
jgi:hypothetical protein